MTCVCVYVNMYCIHDVLDCTKGHVVCVHVHMCVYTFYVARLFGMDAPCVIITTVVPFTLLVLSRVHNIIEEESLY